jgi:RNA polymerase sigma factor (sigma-70 family)
MSLGAQFDTVIAAAKTGVPWALEALYVDLQPRVLRYLNAIDSSQAEDLASEAWLGVARAIPGFNGDEDAFCALLFTVARRRLLDHRRREVYRRTAATEPQVIQELGSSSDAEQEAMDRLGQGWALDQIAALPPDQAEVVMLRVIGDLSVEEVASILGKRPGAVRALQLRALRRLAQQLSKEPITQ